MLPRTMANLEARMQLFQELPYYEALTLLQDFCEDKIGITNIKDLVNSDVESFRTGKRDTPFLLVLPVAIAMLDALVAFICTNPKREAVLSKCKQLAKKSLVLEMLWDLATDEDGPYLRLLRRPEYASIDFFRYAQHVKAVFRKLQFVHAISRKPLSSFFGGRKRIRSRSRRETATRHK